MVGFVLLQVFKPRNLVLKENRMRVYYILPRNSKIQAMAFWPVILANHGLKQAKVSERMMNHERIHHRQQLELFILPFYVWYVLEWVFRWIYYKDRKRAYREISFEREAYAHDGDEKYLDYRKFWAFRSYL